MAVSRVLGCFTMSSRVHEPPQCYAVNIVKDIVGNQFLVGACRDELADVSSVRTLLGGVASVRSDSRHRW